MTEISDLSNNTGLKENAYQMTLKQHIEFLPTINKIRDLSIPRRLTMDHEYKKGSKQCLFVWGRHVCLDLWVREEFLIHT